jgi:hypothetical protein
LGGFPGGDQVVVFAFRVMPDLEDYGTEAPTAPANSTELFRIIVLLVNQVRLVKDLLHFFQTDTMFSLDYPALRSIKLEAHIRI